MADTNLPSGEDPKAVKAKLKADKKEYQKQLKEQKKSHKEKQQEFADRQAELYGDNAGGLATIVITFLIILIWIAIMGLLIKLDVGGFGSDILAPIIKDVHPCFIKTVFCCILSSKSVSYRASLVAQMVMNLPAMQENQV